jgi:hypothetical protein
MDKTRRNFKHAVIRSEKARQQIQTVGANSYVSLFDEGYETVVLFDFKTSVHSDMHDTMFPGLNLAKHEFVKAYGELLLRQQGANTAFAFVDHHSQEEMLDYVESRALTLSAQRRLFSKKRYPNDDHGEKLGAIKVFSNGRGHLFDIDIIGFKPEVENSVTRIGFQGSPLINTQSPMFDKVRFIYGPTKGSILGDIIASGMLNIPERSQVDFSIRNCPTAPV